MQAILTRFHGWNDCQPDRITARCLRGAITIQWDHDHGVEENHIAAAAAFCTKFVAEDKVKYGSVPATNFWSKRRIAAELPTHDYCHILVGPTAA